jgi:glycosyltransferase involved in cell wall biosynthesis
MQKYNPSAKPKNTLQFFAFILANQHGIISQVNSLENASRTYDYPIIFNSFIVQPPFKSRSLLLQLLVYNLRILSSSFLGSNHLLIRFNPRDPLMVLTCLFLRKRVHIVFHTYAEKELKLQKVSCFFFNIYLGLILRLTGKVVAVTHEIGRLYSIKERDFVLMPNSIDYSLVQSLELGKSAAVYPTSRGSKSNIKLLFVASRFAPWQGLDLILEDISSTDADFTLSIVGDHCGQLINDSRIIFLGNQDRLVLNSLYAQSTLGLSCFALYRKGMNEACPLKVREYLAHGLPVYGGHHDVFPPSFPYFCFGPPSVLSILDYHAKIQAIEKAEIKRASREFVDTPMVLEKVFKSLF